MEGYLIVSALAVVLSVIAHAVVRADPKASPTRQWTFAWAGAVVTCIVNGLLLGWLGAGLGAALTFGTPVRPAFLTDVFWRTALASIPVSFLFGFFVGFFRSGRVLPPRPRRVSTCCASCGYNLTGNVSGVCPECGSRVQSTEEGPGSGGSG